MIRDIYFTQYYFCFSVILPSSRVEMVKNNSSDNLCKVHRKKMCWGTFSVFLELKGCNFIITEVRRRCCPVTFAKFFKTVTRHLRVATSGISAILVMVEKPLRIDFLNCVYFTGMTIELKLRSSETK